MIAVIGNDIISLSCQLNQNGFSRVGVSRFFINDYIKPAITEFKSRIFYWAAKETAYKCITKLGYNMAFCPAKFQVLIHSIEENVFQGIVKYDDVTVFVHLAKKTNYVICKGSTEFSTLEKILHFEIIEPPDIAMKLFLENIRQAFFIQSDIVISRNQNGIPYICGPTNKNIDISISHENNHYFFCALSTN